MAQTLLKVDNINVFSRCRLAAGGFLRKRFFYASHRPQMAS